MDGLEAKGYSQITVFSLVGVFTILAGLFLGLLLVAVTDLIWPNYYNDQAVPKNPLAKKEKVEDDEPEKEEKDEVKSRGGNKVRKRPRKAD